MRKYIMNSFIPIFLFNKGKAVQIRRTGLLTSQADNPQTLSAGYWFFNI